MGGFMPYVWVILLPLIGAVVVAITGIFREEVTGHLAAGFGIINAGLALSMIPFMKTGATARFPWLPGISDFTVVADGLGSFIAITAAVLGSLILIYSLGYMEHEHGKTRYYALVLLFIGAMSGLVLSGSLLTLYFFWETVGICSFSLIGFHYEDPKALKGAIKAFITTRLGDVGLITGILVIYFATTPHTFEISAIMENSSTISPAALSLAAFAMLLGAMGKSAQVPLHIWLPGAMEAPTSVSALIHAATMVNAGVYLVARMYPLFQNVPGWTAAVTWVGVVTLLLAALMAVTAKDIKRMLAFSTVSQLGYMFFAVGTGGILASQFHLVSHAIFKALLFLAAGALIHEAGTRDMDVLSGVSSKMPLTSAMYLIGVMGLSGIPLFSGFFSKDMVFSSALERGAYVPLVLAVLGAMLTFTYSWRSYFKVFRGKPSEVLSHAHEVGLAMRIPMILLGIGAVTSWLTVGIQSEALEVLGEGIHAVSPLYLLEETFSSPAFLLSITALGFGTLFVLRYDQVFGWLESHAWKGLFLVQREFYFEDLYGRILSLAHAVGKGFAALVEGAIAGFSVLLGRTVAFLTRCTDAMDSRFIGGFGRFLGRTVRWASDKALTLDSEVIEGSGRKVGSTVIGSAKLVKRAQTGDLNGNLVRLLIGISVILAIVLVETGGCL